MGGYSEKCPYCDRWFTDRYAIHQHERAKHPDAFQPTELDPPFTHDGIRHLGRARVEKIAAETLDRAFENAVPPAPDID